MLNAFRHQRINHLVTCSNSVERESVVLNAFRHQRINHGALRNSLPRHALTPLDSCVWQYTAEIDFTRALSAKIAMD